MSLSGTTAANYGLSATSVSPSANITKATLTVSATGVNKPYDGSATATVTLSDNHLGSDVVTESYTSAAFADKNAANGKTVSVSGIAISGGPMRATTPWEHDGEHHGEHHQGDADGQRHGCEQALRRRPPPR